MKAIRRKVLIAEDDNVSRRILSTMLEKWGYDVISSADGHDAWSLFQANPEIQIVISDWMMPQIDGVDFCRRVRALEGRRYAYFILLTAKTQIDDVVAGMEAGADDFITKPFNQTELQVRIRAGERIVQLENRLANNVEELSRAYEQMHLDLEAAASVQRSMLPPERGKYPGMRYAWSFVPCDKIGGDLFNVVGLDYSRSGVYIFDVSGHGVPAALQSVALGRMLSPYEPHSSLLLRANANGDGHIVVPPKDVTAALNLRFQFATYRGDFITFLYGVMDRESMTFTFSRAGHPCPLHFSGGILKTGSDEGGIPLGIIPEYEYPEHTIELDMGDRLYFYTDGIIEAPNTEGRMFDQKRLCEHLQNASNSSLEDSISGLMREVMAWQAKPIGLDDMTILGIEIGDD
jgi:sigma-B regulation protein RsbU (phosphoserine phosphatase)